MLIYLVMYWIVACGFLLIGSMAEQMLGNGVWTVLNVQHCENADEMPWRLDVKRHRLNRTHYAFDIDLELMDDLDDSCTIRLDLCKMVDGGCKPWTKVSDDCLPKFVKKYAEDNVRLALTLGGIDPPDFPIPKGGFHIQDFILNTDDLPENCVYGEYKMHMYVGKGGSDVACWQGSVEFSPKDDYSVSPAPDR